jgi:hypothetical protein
VSRHGSPGSADEQFADALALEEPADGDRSGQDLPARLARATALVLSASGAGISLLTDDPLCRLPLAATDTQASLAEQLQFTTGEGPCLTAHSIGQAGFSDQADMARRWPAFHDLLVQRTSYTAVASLPLRDRGRSFGALDLYFIDPGRLRELDTVAAVLTAGIVAEHLTLAAMIQPTGSQDMGSPWFQAASGPRLATWQAVGMLLARQSIGTDEAVRRLRRWALDRQMTTDELAAGGVSGELQPADL